MRFLLSEYGGQGLRFLVVGVVGFFVDTGCTIALIAAGIDPLVARIPALGLAIVATWTMNGIYTFPDHAELDQRSLARYAGVAISVAVGNYVIYAVLITVGIAPLPAIAIATLLGMSASFFGYRNFAFRRRPARPDRS